MKAAKRVVAALTVALAAAWVYEPCLRGKWLWDDGLEVSQNPALRSPGGWWESWLHPQGMDYFPLKSSLQWVEWHLWGADPTGYHLVNLGLHILSALLVWRLLELLGVRAAPLGALLFAVHPLAVESVAWISEFKNTVSLPLLLLSAIAFVEFERDGRRGVQAAALLLFCAALLCKTSVVMFPFVLLLFAWWRSGRISVRDLRAAAPFFALSLAAGAVTVWFQSTRAIGVAGIPESMGARAAQAGWSILDYARQSVWPSGLEPIYPSAAVSWTAILPWIAVAACLAFFWRRRAGWGRHALLGCGWFLLNLVPVLGLIPMSYFRVSPRADHFGYVPLVGIIGLATAGFGAALDAWQRRRGPGRAARLPFAIGAMAVVGALAVQARTYAAVFRDEKALWSYAADRNPGAWLARANLGKVLLEEKRPEEAAEQFRAAILRRPDSFEALAGLGNCLQAQGLALEARDKYAAALEINPRFAGGHYDLGVSLLASREFDEAAAQFRTALALDPAYATAENNLGLALSGLGRLPEAMEEYKGALRINPDLPEAHLNLGNALLRAGSAEAAVAEYREALRLAPGYSGAHNNLGYALAKLGRQGEADAEFEAAHRSASH